MVSNLSEEKGNQVQYISMKNIIRVPGRQGVEKRPFDKLIFKFFDFRECSLRICLKCTTKIQNAFKLF